MMLGSKSRQTDLVRQVGDLWSLEETTGQYRAWKCWMQFQFGIKFFPKRITVTAEWPPATQLGADRYAQFLSDIRDEIDNEKFHKKIGAPVLAHPEPWDGYIPPVKPVDDSPPITMEFVREFYRKHGLSLGS